VEVTRHGAATEQRDNLATEVHVLQGRLQVQLGLNDEGGVPHVMTTGKAAVFRNSLSQGFYVEEKKMNRAIFVGLALAVAAAEMDSAKAVTIFNGGNIHQSANWSSGLPTSSNPGEINVDGTLHNATIALGVGSV